MTTRKLGFFDQFVGEIDKAIKVLTLPARVQRPFATRSTPPPTLSDADRKESGRLMRVNHAGEVAAQALYQGQALVARDAVVAAALRRAAAEEADHLAWCQQRLNELGARPSLLNPFWYLGSFVIGTLAGVTSDAISLGFIAETEKQVEAHLRDHLQRLPPADERSRAVITQMTHDEIAHGQTAAAMGAKTLPFPVVVAMRWSSRAMTRGSYWL
jgi:ubiquinone biosynthesis monooxygenase Coq7